MAVPFLEFWDSTDSAVVSATISSNKNAGDTIAAVTYHLFNDKGGSHSSTTASLVRLVAEAFDGLNWVRTGIPALDEGWLQVSVTGQDNTGDATMEAQTTGYIPLGTNRFLLLKDIPKNCARYISAKSVIPAGAATSAPKWRLVPYYDEASIPLASKSSIATGGGVIPDFRDPSLRRLRTGRGLTAVGTAVVTIAKGGWTYDGLRYFRKADTVTLNQTAADGALSSGQSYIAVISQPQTSGASTTAAPTVTKGNKGSSPVAPATPVGEIFLGKVTVAFQAGGTSIINTGNLDMTGVTYGEYFVRTTSGFGITIGAGTAISTVDTLMINTAASTLSLTPSQSSYIYLLSDGTFTSQISTAAAPSASVLLAIASTDGSGVTGLTDLRAYADRPTATMTLKYRGPHAVATTLDWDTLEVPAILDHWRVSTGVLPPTFGQSNILDINSHANNLDVPGTTIFTSQGTEDHRPAIPGATASSPPGGLTGNEHEVTIFGAGTYFSFDIDTITAGAGTDVTVQLVFRPQN